MQTWRAGHCDIISHGGIECDGYIVCYMGRTMFYTHLWPLLLYMAGLAVSLWEGARLVTGVGAIRLLTFDLGPHLVKKGIPSHTCILLVHIEAACHVGAWRGGELKLGQAARRASAAVLRIRVWGAGAGSSGTCLTRRRAWAHFDWHWAAGVRSWAAQNWGLRGSGAGRKGLGGGEGLAGSSPYILWHVLSELHIQRVPTRVGMRWGSQAVAGPWGKYDTTAV